MPPRFHLELTLQALAAGKHVLVEKPAFLRMADYEAVVDGARCRAPRGARRRERSLQAAGRVPAATVDGGRDRRDGVRALHDARAAAQVRRRLAQRRDDGRRGRVSSKKASTGCTWPAASARRSRRFTGYRPAVSREGPDSAREEHDGGVSLRQRRRRVALLLARDPVAAARDCGCRSCSAARASSRSSRTARSSSCAAAGCRGWCFRASATSAATGRCIATSSGRSATAARPR